MSVKSSSTVFHALRHLAVAARPVSAAELAVALAVPVTNAARALATLEAAGYAERHQGAPRYVIGKSARTLAHGFMAQFPVRDLAMPYLQQLTLETGLTSSLFVRLGWFALRIARILGPSVLIHRTSLGEAVKLTEAAPALAILAYLADDSFGPALAKAARCDDSVALQRVCDAIRADGISSAPSLTEAGAFDLATPLLDRRDHVVAAIAVEGISGRDLPDMTRADSAARRVMRDLAAKIRLEQSIAMSHYEHIDPDLIEL